MRQLLITLETTPYSLVLLVSQAGDETSRLHLTCPTSQTSIRTTVSDLTLLSSSQGKFGLENQVSSLFH